MFMPRETADCRSRVLMAMLAFSFFASAAHAQGPADGLQEAWWSAVRNQVASQEYGVTWQETTVIPGLENAWHAPNRAHDLRTYFTGQGIHVVRRTAREPDWIWRLSLAGYGRGGQMWQVMDPVISPEENRVEYDRGDIVEWYVNGRRGLKQGFTLATRPERAGIHARRSVPATGGTSSRCGSIGTGCAYLQFILRGNLSPTVGRGAKDITFASPEDASVLHYGALRVYDSTERDLDAWFDVVVHEGRRLVRIVFDDEDAVYPVTVDPLATTPSWTAEIDQESAAFGWSVSTAGDVNADGYSDVIVGARYYDGGESDEGAAFVYHGSSSGLSSSYDWMAEGNHPSAVFGGTVSTAGDVNGDGYGDVVVGADNYDNGQMSEGRAWVYLGSPSGLASAAAWMDEGDQVEARFGRAVSTAGDVNGDGYGDLVVGAPEWDGDETDEGRVLVYLGSSAGLSASPDWTQQGDQADSNFGADVGIAGDVNGDGFGDVIVGASTYGNDQVDEGVAFVYYGSPGGLSEEADWMGEADQANAAFGGAVLTAGDVNGDGYTDVVVGAYLYDDSEENEGRAFIFEGSESGLSTSPTWTVDGEQANAALGASLSTAGDIDGDGYADVVVSARVYDNGEANEGRAYVYFGSSTGLAATPGWTGESNQAEAEFGRSVATAGDVDGDGYADLIVGASYFDNGESDEGRAYVYRGSAGGLAPDAAWTRQGGQSGAKLSYGHTAGDVNGDGFGDVIVSAPLYDGGQVDEGKAWVFHGSPSGLETSPSWTTEMDQAGATLSPVGTAGDVNGDGYADVILGAHLYDGGEPDEGRAFVYRGSAAGLSDVPSWTAESDQAEAHFGIAVASAGDVNGDGYSDVVVGARLYDSGELDEGGAWVYEGSPAGLRAEPSWNSEIDQAGARFGGSVASAGDVNADGYSDVVVGARFYDGGSMLENVGRAFVFHGSATGLEFESSWEAGSNRPSAEFGISVAGAGDVNGDGYSDLIVGAWGDSDGFFDNEGAAYVYHGSLAGLEGAAAWSRFGGQFLALFGNSVSTAGDVNGDGFADVIVGSFVYDNGETDEGRAYVYHGSSAGLPPVANWTAESDQVEAEFGTAVSTAGDVNGDGYTDVIVSSEEFDTASHENAGQAFVFYGNEGPGLSLVPRQRRVDKSAPIGHLGRSDDEHSFRVALSRARTPFGRAEIKVEFEVKELAAAYDGTDTLVTDSWIDSGTEGAEVSEVWSELESGRPYHWRTRVIYESATTPLAQRGRWLTIPWDGWLETDLRAGGWSVTCVIDDLGFPSLEDKSRMTWNASNGCENEFDTARVDVRTVISSGGDYSTATCLENNGSDQETTDAADPAAGESYGYLVRGDGQSYNTNSSSQRVSRDGTLAACP